MVHLYYATRAGMGGASVMPEAGGYLDQLALTTQAFAFLGHLDAEARKESA